MHEENKFTFHDPNNDSVLNEPFNIAELNTAIDKSKCTTPGKDKISNNIIKHIPLKTKQILLLICNTIWNTSQFPIKWKEAILIPLLKPGKNPSDPISYRPIALTSSLCKLMERMVNSRLSWYLEHNNLLGYRQSGFRKGRCTTDHLVQLESSINKGFAN